MTRIAFALLASNLLACSIQSQKAEIGVYELPDASGPTSNPPVLFLLANVRDFKRYKATDPTTNPAFDNLSSEKGVVADALGADDKPVYKAPSNASPTFGRALFDQWYNDTPGTNYSVVYPLPVSLTSTGQYEYDSQKSGAPDVFQGMSRRVFAPIDDRSPYATPFGNQGGPHNFAFTAELHAVLTLAHTGATLRARSDDDLYIFIDGKLAIDLGGTHVSSGTELQIDDLALTVGQDYSLDIFYAERLGASADLAVTIDLPLKPKI